jgi:hypothetical protein
LVELFDGRTTVVVKAANLSANLAVGARYRGELRAGANKVANVELVVLGGL